MAGNVAPPPLQSTLRAFANWKLELHSINIDPQGRVEFWYHDGGMFWGHDIEVNGTLGQGPRAAVIAG